MIRRSLLTAALVLVGSVAMAPKTMADTVDIPFSAQVGGSCTFGPVTSGVLALMIGPSPTPGSPSSSNILAASSPNGGSMGKVSVTCNQPANLRVSQPVQTGGPTFTPVMSNAFVSSPSGFTDSFAGSAPITLNPDGTPTPLEIDMMVEKDSPLESGTYNYKVTLTLTP